MLKVSRTDDGVAFAVHAKPRARKSAVLGVREGALEVAIAAPPVDGAANEELRATLAKALGVPKRDVTIVRGESARHKKVAVANVDEAAVVERLAPG